MTDDLFGVVVQGREIRHHRGVCICGCKADMQRLIDVEHQVVLHGRVFIPLSVHLFLSLLIAEPMQQKPFVDFALPNVLGGGIDTRVCA
jgi:hypothetical protein